MKRNAFILLIFLFMGSSLQAQRAPSLDIDSEYMKTMVKYLSSDEMEGRETGTKGEQKAADYIIREFKRIGLVAKGDQGSYIQTFDAYAGKVYGANNELNLNSQSCELHKNYFAFEYSKNGFVKGKLVSVGHGIAAKEEGFDDYKGKKKLKNKIFVIETATPENNNPHGELAKFNSLEYKAEVAKSKGAKGIIFINSAPNNPDPKARLGRNIPDLGIPIIFSKNPYLIKKEIGQKISFRVELKDDVRKGKNVIGYLNNNADKTIIIGGHYDHLGYGAFGSRNTSGKPEIHNGADDNASGIAVITRAAEKLKTMDLKTNVLFIAFSGEEMGLLGSKYFVEHPTIDLKQANFMVNLDMVGRMKNHTLLVSGTGSSPEWGNILVKAAPPHKRIKLETSESAVGPSDHTSFYFKDIPVLFLFTGVHKEYHTSDDDYETLNYRGMKKVLDLVTDLVETTHDMKRLNFTKTAEPKDSGGARRFNVTLGVMPSYAYSGPGLKLDGVTKGKAAAKAGILADDIIVKMGETEIKDIYTYMDLLEKYHPGDKIKVRVKRGGKEKEFDVEF